jgi:hypothetical protein
MSICKKEFSATQYALLSATFRITGIIAGVLSGWAATHIGYAQYFFLTFFLSLPAFAFLFYARDWIPTDQNASNSGKSYVAPPKRESPILERTAQAVVVPLPQAKAS